MLNIGEWNSLEVVKEVDFGLYLDGEQEGEILLPRRYVPEGVEVGDTLDVFIYTDSEDRIIATTEKPLAQVGQLAALEVVAVNRIGAFLNWGLMKDLLVPYREQYAKLNKGDTALVYVYLDEESDRVVASCKLEKFMKDDPVVYEPGQQVEAWVADTTEIGYKMVVNMHTWGMLYKNEVFQPLKIGDKVQVYVTKQREDNKLDLSLHKFGREKIKDFADVLFDFLEAHEGFVPLTDKSPAEAIYDTFGVSKKVFKKGIGSLYKARKITITPEGLHLKREE
jgi:predicted RNA-binding protein (virulence factor B family)